MKPVSLVYFLVVVAIALGSTSCVSRSQYDRVEGQKSALEIKEAQLAKEVATLKLANRGLAESLTASATENVAMRNTYDQLLIELEGEVESGQIEVQQLIDGIQLNVSDKLLFASGSASLNEVGVDLIRRVADKVKDERAVIDVEGHTDSEQIGPALRKLYPTNWELAGARASSVVRQLSQDGVPPNRLRSVSRGPFDPIASNDTAEGRAKNRRTEIVLRLLPQ